MKIDLSFLPVLFIVLLVMKLSGTAKIGWLWVFAPLWGPIAVIPLLFLMTVFLYAVLELIDCLR